MHLVSLAGSNVGYTDSPAFLLLGELFSGSEVTQIPKKLLESAGSYVF